MVVMPPSQWWSCLTAGQQLTLSPAALPRNPYISVLAVVIFMRYNAAHFQDCAQISRPLKSYKRAQTGLNLFMQKVHKTCNLIGLHSTWGHQLEMLSMRLRIEPQRKSLKLNFHYWQEFHYSLAFHIRLWLSTELPCICSQMAHVVWQRKMSFQAHHRLHPN